MRQRNQTTVVLTKIAQEVKDDLAPIYGLKNILSAGLTIFGKLSDTGQKEAIAEANSPQQKGMLDKRKQQIQQLEANIRRYKTRDAKVKELLAEASAAPRQSPALLADLQDIFGVKHPRSRVSGKKKPLTSA